MADQEMTKAKAEKLLGLSGTYDSSDIRKSYLDAIKTYHPDRFSQEGEEKEESTLLAAEINEAKSYLVDLLKSSGADTLKVGNTQSATAASSYSYDVDFGNYAESSYRASTGQSAHSQPHYSYQSSAYQSSSAYQASPQAEAKAAEPEVKREGLEEILYLFRRELKYMKKKPENVFYPAWCRNRESGQNVARYIVSIILHVFSALLALIFFLDAYRVTAEMGFWPAFMGWVFFAVFAYITFAGFKNIALYPTVEACQKRYNKKYVVD